MELTAEFIAKDFIQDYVNNGELEKSLNGEFHFKKGILNIDPELKEHRKQLNKIGLDLIVSTETPNAYKLIKIK